MIRVTVRDGRVGRDQTLVDGGGGQVLDQFDADAPLEIGQQLTLPGGAQAEVIHVLETTSATEGWKQVVTVGDVWST
jgi:hypothetical protein